MIKITIKKFAALFLALWTLAVGHWAASAAVGGMSLGGTSTSLVYTNRLLTTIDGSETTNRIYYTNASAPFAAFGNTNLIHIRTNAATARWEWHTDWTTRVATNSANRPTGTWYAAESGAALYGYTRYEPRNVGAIAVTPGDLPTTTTSVSVDTNGVITYPEILTSFDGQVLSGSAIAGLAASTANSTITSRLGNSNNYNGTFTGSFSDGNEININLPPYNAVGDGVTVNSNASFCINLICATSTVPLTFKVPQGAFIMNNLTGGLAGWRWEGKGYERSAILYNTNIVSSGDQQNAKFLFRNEFGPSWFDGLRIDGQAYLTNMNTAQSGTTNVYLPRDQSMERNAVLIGANTNMPQDFNNCLVVNFYGQGVHIRGRYDNFGNGTVNKMIQVRNSYFTNVFNPVYCDDAGTSDYIQLSNLRGDNVYVALLARGGNISGNGLTFTRGQVGVWADNSRFHDKFDMMLNHFTTAMILKDCATTAVWSGVNIRGGGDILLWGTTSNQWFQNINMQGGNFGASTTTSNNWVKNCHFNTRPTVTGGGTINFVSESCTTDELGYGVWPKKFVFITDLQANGVGPHGQGTSPAAGWTNRWFNTLDNYSDFCTTNSGTGNTGSNSFTLPPGQFEVQAAATAYSCLRTVLMLSNVTTGTISIMGQNAYAVANSQVIAQLNGRLNLTASNTFVLRQYFESAATPAFGLANNTGLSGVGEIYTRIKITKE